ncbi:hypothetical protein [Saccharopolyspora pogona]|uniref:hypothetical protein n=1 Tax=Saccharopolyspora pogona TaxID=333966 RepID=UPI00168703F4|nr:hypothetical protein [Saccharopolyspora pogona]
MTDYLTYVWRPVPGGRHAFPIAATKVPHEERVKAAELHDRSEVDWIREDTCMRCWYTLTTSL